MKLKPPHGTNSDRTLNAAEALESRPGSEPGPATNECFGIDPDRVDESETLANFGLGK